jgi:hypothetical protein
MVPPPQSELDKAEAEADMWRGLTLSHLCKWCRREALQSARERQTAAGGDEESLKAFALQPHDDMTLFHDQWGFGTRWCLCIFTHSVRPLRCVTSCSSSLLPTPLRFHKH